MITARLSINQALTVRAVPKTGLGSCMACMSLAGTAFFNREKQLEQIRHLGSTGVNFAHPRNRPPAENKLPIPAQEHWKLTHHQASRLSTAVDAPAPLDFTLLSSRPPDFLSSASLIPLMEELEHGREAPCSHLIKATSIHTPRAELRTELCLQLWTMLYFWRQSVTLFSFGRTWLKYNFLSLTVTRKVSSCRIYGSTLKAV